MSVKVNHPSVGGDVPDAPGRHKELITQKKVVCAGGLSRTSAPTDGRVSIRNSIVEGIHKCSANLGTRSGIAHLVR